MATGKTVAFTRQTFVGKAMSLLSNMLSRLVITYLPKSKHLSISWLKSPSTMIFFFFFSYLEPVCCSMSSFNCCFLTCIQVSQEAGQVVWYIHLFQNFPQFIVIHTVKGFGIVKKAEIDVFMELSRFFDDPSDVGNLIFGSSAFSKISLNIRKFKVRILLKLSLENFERYFISMLDECNCVVN